MAVPSSFNCYKRRLDWKTARIYASVTNVMKTSREENESALSRIYTMHGRLYIKQMTFVFFNRYQGTREPNWVVLFRHSD